MRWYSHDAGAIDDIDIVRLHVKFGWDGYGIFFAFLELQAIEEGPIKLDEAIAVRVRTPLKRLQEVLGECARLGIIDKGKFRRGFIFSPNLESRADNYSKRKKRESDSAEKPTSKIAEWCKKIEDAWHKTDLPRIVNWSGPRKEKLEARTKNEYFCEHVVEAIEKMGASGFCNGKNERKWTATIDFLLANDNNFVKALEGKYDERGEAQHPLMKKYGVTV